MNAFVFDVDDTLYDQVQPFKRAYDKMFGDENTPDKNIPIEQLFAVSRKYSDEVFEASVNGTITMDEMYIYRIQNALREFGVEITDEQGLEFQQYYANYQQEISMTELIRKLIEVCKERATVGIITNGPAAHQWDKVHALKLHELVPTEHIIVSGDYDFAKPDKRIFQLIANRLQTCTDHCYFVGDSLETDVQGSMAAGWKSIWFNRRNRAIDQERVPDYIVETEQELYDLIISLL